MSDTPGLPIDVHAITADAATAVAYYRALLGLGGDLMTPETARTLTAAYVQSLAVSRFKAQIVLPPDPGANDAWRG